MSVFNRGLGVLVVVAAMMAACEKKPSNEDRPATPGPSSSDAATVETTLARADAVDGKVDKIVAKCLGCGLGMDGKKEFAATTAGYALHFCAAGCQADFEKDPNRAVTALRIPGE